MIQNRIACDLILNPWSWFPQVLGHESPEVVSCDPGSLASPGPDTFTTIRLSQDEDEAAAGVFTSSGLILPRPTLARQYNAGK